MRYEVRAPELSLKKRVLIKTALYVHRAARGRGMWHVPTRCDMGKVSRRSSR